MGQQRDVAGALAQRRQLDRDHVDAVVELLAELPLGDGLAQVAVRRRHDAHVHVDERGAADAADLPLLQRAQELDLER